MIAKDMTPGRNYRGTADGPAELDGVVFTVLSTVTFNAESPLSVPDDELDPGTLVQVQYDAWAFPFPEVTTFAPGDWVEELSE